MARISEQVLAGLARPAFAQGMFDLGAAIGRVPGQIQQRRKQEQLAEIMKAGNTALTTGDATNIGRVRRQLEEAGFAAEAAKMAQAEAQARQQQATRGMLMSAVSGEPLSREVIQERLGEGLTAQGLSSALQAREALKPAPFFNRAEQIDLLGLGYKPQNIAQASQKSDISLLGTPVDDEDPTVSSTITEWTDPTRPSEGVVLRTVQDNDGNTLELGTKARITGDNLKGLERKTKPPVSVTLSQERESALAKTVGEDIANEVSDQITKAGEAMNLRSTLAEAKLIAQDQPDVFGAGAEFFSGGRRAALTLMRSFGVKDNDPLMVDFKEKEGSVDQIRSFTQDFVKTRLEATKGAISDKEFTTFIASVPNLLKTPGGYLTLLNQMESLNERAIMKGMALREARIAEDASQAINDVEKTWDKFSSDFTYSTFMPPEEQRKLWNAYLQKKGDVDKGNDVVFTLSSGAQQGSVTYNDLVRRAAKNEQTTSQYIYDLYYGNTGKTIELDLSGFNF